MRSQSHLLLLTQISGVPTRCDRVLNPLDHKLFDASYIEIEPDALRKLITDYLDVKKSISQSWKRPAAAATSSITIITSPADQGQSSARQ